MGGPEIYLVRFYVGTYEVQGGEALVLAYSAQDAEYQVGMKFKMTKPDPCYRAIHVRPYLESDFTDHGLVNFEQSVRGGNGSCVVYLPNKRGVTP